MLQHYSVKHHLHKIGPQVNRESIRLDKSSWFNETVDELVCRLHSFSMESFLTHTETIPTPSSSIV